MFQVPTLYLNENMDPKLVTTLAGYGIKAIHTLSVNKCGVKDEFQLEYAAKNNYILVSHNRRHFRKLHKDWVDAGRIHPGILTIGMSECDVLATRIKCFFEKYYFATVIPFCITPPLKHQ
jgi:hypothetical protein